MHSITRIHHSKYNEIVQWCVENIGEQKYYLHTQVGGLDWHIYHRCGYYELQINSNYSESIITLLLLKYGQT